MKALLLSLVITAIASCSTNTSQVSSQELPASDPFSADSLSSEPEEAWIATEEDPDALMEAIQLEIEKTSSGFDETGAKEYTILSSFKGYENTSEGIWILDSLLNLEFCEVDWGMEGSSGSYTYYFSDENILAAEEQNYYNDYEETVWIHSKFKPIFGFSKTNGTENDSIPYFFQEAEYISKNEQAKQDFSRLLLRIRELQDSLSSNGDEIIIVTENVVDYGEDFTETEKYVLSKTLFNIMVKDQ
ncbi:MAG: hypothetical protein WEB30_13545 [Cyclobacteriaceae bacterium]